ncbi:DUF3810 domain-containing protein [Sphingobacterium bovistauri]|uniref:DUF3810 domain-containing protein n=1 Tax=Sphingobacterium bovistauri TaxID=2781959 RepID=A0ABS7Z0H4_9SPHI|nr:DUF3810 domain-containing protein [Sphingobacterium bovistauri]MCA5003667.1 DUF3810 domain-containing protein [Sphingobacterium bovistauri]
MKHKASNGSLKKYIYSITVCLILIFLIEGLTSNSVWVEEYYAQHFYPAVSYLYIILFSWIPFSVGDLFYAGAALFLIYSIITLFKNLFLGNLPKLKISILRLVVFLLAVYVLFNVNWGLNYYRVSVSEKLGISDYKITREEYLVVLDRYIAIANVLREQVDITAKSKNGVKGDIEELVIQDTLLDDYLCKTQIQSKSPISSGLASYFTVSGYFNPFTLEVQVNQHIPNASYPFVNVHELAHQMGVGFEDECNFIAFLTLKDNQDLWYKYSAYYTAVEYLMYPLYGDKELLKIYKEKLSPLVLNDFKVDREFWMSYRGWVNKVSGMFYNQFLKHNNQPEGMERYSMMTRLLVAWEKKQQEEIN